MVGRVSSRPTLKQRVEDSPAEIRHHELPRLVTERANHPNMRILPIAFLTAAVLASAAWVGLLGYGLFQLITFLN